MLYGDQDGSLEGHGVFHVEPVEADVAAPVVPAAQGDAVVRRGVLLLRAPGCVEVVFGTRPVKGRRPSFTIYKDHVVPLPVPVPLIRLAEVVDVEHAADVVAASLGFQDRVVAATGAGDILSTEEELLVALALFCDAVRGVLPAPLGVKATEAILEVVELFVIHVVVEQYLLVLELALDLYPGTLGERHVEKAVEGLAVLGAHLQGRRDEVRRAGVADAEEISQGHEHARLFFSIPVHL